MFKGKQLVNIGKKFLRPSQNTTHLQYFRFSQQNNENKDKQSSTFNMSLLLVAGTVITYSALARKNQTQAEDKEDPKQQSNPSEDQEEKPSYWSFKQPLEIPKLLLERQKQKQEEYRQRANIEVKDIDKNLTKDDLKQMNDLDKLFNNMQEADGEEDEYKGMNLKLDEDEESQAKDPYVQKNTLRHQEYRIIKLGNEDLLKNGQMIQISVSDPFNEKVFHPTDKIIVAKHNERYFACGSFCGFDYTNLATGAFLGDKLICPTCGSNYNIQNGFVDQGPSLRNIASFMTQVREDQLQVIIPEHVPAFAQKKFIQRATIDPRTYIIVGDSEAALSAIDALRTNFTGKIVCIPCSPFGQFENIDVLNRKFGPINKNESYYVESDYLNRANVEVVKGELKYIDLQRKAVLIKGINEMIPYEKILIAWGANKKRLTTDYANVYYLEDRHSHAKCHNEIIKAKTIVVMGGTFEAYQTAASIRKYLDSLQYTDTKIILFDGEKSEIQNTFGTQIANELHKLMKEQRISVIMDADVTKFSGINRLQAIYFKKKKAAFEEKNVEFFINPDVVIAENGLGEPKFNLKNIIKAQFDGDEGEAPIQIGIDPQGVPASDIKFSLHYNDIHSPIFAAGSATQYPSFFHKVRVRTNDVKYNIESGFFAAMNMLDKRVEFRYVPFTPINLGNTPVYYIGERNSPFHEIVINGSVEKRKFVAYFLYGNEVTGILTCGFQNLHLYLWEAMKLMIMPTGDQLRQMNIDYKQIAAKVLLMKPYIKCKRHEIIGLPSVMLAEREGELEKSENLRKAVKANIDAENLVQKKRFQKLKEKYDREGVEFVEDEMDIAARQQYEEEQEGSGERKRANTMQGGRKPGQTSSKEGLATYRQNFKMADEDDRKNPLNPIINMAKQGFGRGGPPPAN